jgi:hypothetical protein
LLVFDGGGRWWRWCWWWKTTTILENECACSFSMAVEGGGVGNKRAGPGGIEPSPFVSKHVENKWGGVEPSPFMSNLLKKRQRGVVPSPLVKLVKQKEK